jgi:hypothetical protein
MTARHSTRYTITSLVLLAGYCLLAYRIHDLNSAFVGSRWLHTLIVGKHYPLICGILVAFGLLPFLMPAKRGEAAVVLILSAGILLTLGYALYA